jgi:nucleoside-diphosphate-sugar epimerase
MTAPAVPVETVLITGAFGRIGKRCTEILLSRGRTVIAADLRNDQTVATANEFADRTGQGTLVPVWADLLEAAAVRDLVALHQPGAIVHLAGIFPPSSYRNPRLARKVNVEGTRNLMQAATALAVAPLILEASSASVYGSRNPHRYPEHIGPDVPVNPIDQYGEDKVLAEAVVSESGLPYAVLRLAAVISPDGAANHLDSDGLLLMRAMPSDNRMHTVDARDVGLAFANAVDRRDSINGKVLLIAGDETHLHLQRDLEDDMMEAFGMGRLGPSASPPGDPDNDWGWSFTGWFDTTESQALLDFQQHDWSQTTAWMADAQGRRRMLLQALGPVIRPLMRLVLSVQRRVDGLGEYADPWTLIGKKFGPDVLAPTNF